MRFLKMPPSYLIVVVALTGAILTAATSPALAASSASPNVGGGASGAMCCTHHGDLGGPLYGSSAYPNARGLAHYDSCCGHREFDANLWNVRSLAGKTLTVYAGGQRIGTMIVRSDGTCNIHRDTRNGQNVPTLSAGATVAVRTGSGALVASGTLRRMMM